MIPKKLLNYLNSETNHPAPNLQKYYAAEQQPPRWATDIYPSPNIYCHVAPNIGLYQLTGHTNHEAVCLSLVSFQLSLTLQQASNQVQPTNMHPICTST